MADCCDHCKEQTELLKALKEEVSGLTWKLHQAEKFANEQSNRITECYNKILILEGQGR